MARWSDTGTDPRTNGSAAQIPDDGRPRSSARNPMVRFVAIMAIAAMVLTLVGSALILLLS